MTLEESIDELAHEYRRDVGVAFVYNHHAWRAEMAGLIAQSMVGPADALAQLEAKARNRGLSRDATDRIPAAGARP